MSDLSKLAQKGKAFATKADAAYEILREAILAGYLKPGSPILPNKLVMELNMSIIPIREALHRLNQDGLITIRPHVGATVRALPIEELEETMLIRGELEALATRLAVASITPEVLAKLEHLVAEMDACEKDWNPERFGRLNREFHLTIYRASKYQRLAQLIDSLWDQVPRARSVFALVPDFMRKSQEGHYHLLEALRNRDADKADLIMREQKASALNALIQAVAKQEQNSPSGQEIDREVTLKEA